MNKRKRNKILIVDDEIGIRELLTEILIDEGYIVLSAHDAQSAIQARQEGYPDLILLDIWMPGMDGISLLRQWVNEGQCNVPVIVMSGHATIDMAVEATRLGAIEVLEKPITTALLLRTIRKSLTETAGRDINPALQQAQLGETSIMSRFKANLLDASSTHQPLLMIGAVNSGVEFFARLLVPPKTSTILITNGVKLENDLSHLVQRYEGGLIILRAIETYTKKQQQGLLGLLSESLKFNTRVVACSCEIPSVLSETVFYNETVLGSLSRCVIEVPTLTEVVADIPFIVNLILQRLAYLLQEGTIEITTAAVNELVSHSYKDDFVELAAIIRSAWYYAQPGKIDSTIIKMVLRELDSFGNKTSNEITENIYNMPLRQARECFEREYFTRLINQTDGNVLQAAKIAQLERTYFYRKLKQYQT